MYYEQVSTSLVKRENGFALICIQSPSKTIVTHYGNCNNCPLPLFHFGMKPHAHMCFSFIHQIGKQFAATLWILFYLDKQFSAEEADVGGAHE
jgi:hypothetical protein